MKYSYSDIQKRKIIELIEKGFFNTDKGNGIFRKKNHNYILEHYENNFYPPILDEAI